MSEVTANVYRDDYGYLVATNAGSPGLVSVYRPMPSGYAYEPRKAFGKLRDVATVTKFSGDTEVKLVFYGKEYVIVHSKDPKYGKSGLRELWVYHGDARTSTHEAWYPYEKIAKQEWKEYMESAISNLSRGPQPDAVVSPVKELPAPKGAWSRTDQFIKQLRQPKRSKK